MPETILNTLCVLTHLTTGIFLVETILSQFYKRENRFKRQDFNPIT